MADTRNSCSSDTSITYFRDL